MANDIIVKIGADAKQFNAEIDKIKEKTADLEDNLASIAKISGGLFAGLVASAGVAINAFRGAEKATQELTSALENQGIEAAKTVKVYRSYASAVQDATGLDDDAVVSAQARIQTLIGQTEVTEELTFAIADLGTQTGSLESAAEILGRAYQGNTRALKQYGIIVDENASAQERLQQTIDGVNQRFGGQATAVASGVGSIKKLQSAFGDLLEEIGARLAPTFVSITDRVTAFIKAVQNNKPLLDFVVSAGKIAAIASGIVAALATAGLAFIKFNQILTLAGVAVKTFGITARAATLATGIGALIAVAVLVYENWSFIWPALKGIFVGAVEAIVQAAGALSKIFNGIVNRDFALISEGVEKFKASIGSGIEAGKAEFTATRTEVTKEETKPDDAEKKRLAQKKELADQAAAEQRRRDALNAEQAKNSQEIALLQATQASEEVIKLKQQENEILKALEEEKNANVIAALEQRLEQVRLLEREAALLAAEDKAILNEEILASNEEFQALTAEQQALFRAQNQAALLAQVQNEKDVRNALLTENLKKQIEANNTYLKNQQQFGTVYAEINRIIYSEQVQGAAKGFGELTQLTQSNNSTLKSIGKAAAVADITIKTAQSAMNIFNGFSAIPFIGTALGIAGAAAAVAFGAEQIGRVTAAQEGGIVGGFNNGGDSVPALLQPGELVVPRQNFSQVIQAVAARQAEIDAVESQATPTTAPAGAGSNMIAIGFDGIEAEKVITARRVEARSLGTLREARGIA